MAPQAAATTPFRQTKFNAGEISPQMYGDTSWPKYGAATRKCLNWIPLPEGALLARPGWAYTAPIKNQAVKGRLIPFIFSDNTTFVLEFGNLYARFYTLAQYVGAAPGYAPNAGAYYELVTPYTTAMLPYLKYAQVGNTITLCYGGQVPGVAALPPQDLVKTDSALGPWTLSNTITKTTVLTWNAPPPGVSIFSAKVAAYSAAATYNVGDRVTTVVSGSTVDWTCIQSNVTGSGQQPPTSLSVDGAMTGIAGNLYWTPSMDAAHPAAAWTLGITVVWQDSTGVTYESLVSASVSFTGVIASDRPLPILINSTPVIIGGTTLYYKYYRGQNNVLGFITQLPYQVGGPAYVDLGNTPDYTQQPPQGTDPFIVNGTDSYPSVVGYIDQRRAFGSSLKLPNAVQTSAAGNLYRFDQPIPGNNADASTLILASNVLEQVRSFMALKCNILFTGQGEWVFPDGPYTKGSSPKKLSPWGSSWIDPIGIGNGAIFNTAKSNQVRDFFPLYGLYTTIWDGVDLTRNARHFFERHTITSWALQTVPYPVLWVVREDGVLLSLTYVRGSQEEPGVVAWAQHTTGNGDSFESVCVVPEPPEDALYAIIRRTVNGQTVRYIERAFSPIPPTDQRFSTGLDCSVTFDGRNTTTYLKMTNAGSTNPADYVVGTQITATLYGPAGAQFQATDPNLSNIVFDSEDTLGFGSFQAKIVGYISATQVIAELQSNLTQDQVTAWTNPLGHLTEFGLARSVYTVPHLLGLPVDSGNVGDPRGVAALVDAQAVAGVTFVGGVVTLPLPGLVVSIGLLYNCDMGLLDVYSPNAEIRNKYKEVKRVGFEVANSRSLWVGIDFDNLTEWEERDVSDSYNVMGLSTGYFSEFVPDEWNVAGRAVVRHFSPLPCIIVSVLREVAFGGN